MRSSLTPKARPSRWCEDSDKKARAKKLDGSYVLKTDRQDLTADEIWRSYILLTRVEDAFRDMKSPLMERPIFHQLKHRTQTHIFLCVLAYHLLAVIEQYFLDQGIHTSWATLRDELSTHQVVTVVLPTESEGVLRIRKGTTPEPVHREIYETLQVPVEVMAPVKTWTPAGLIIVTEKKRKPSSTKDSAPPNSEVGLALIPATAFAQQAAKQILNQING